jgi:hypothetical protein
MMLVGLYPMLAVALVYIAQYGFIEAAVETHVFTWLGLTGILALGWFAFICIQIVRNAIRRTTALPALGSCGSPP